MRPGATLSLFLTSTFTLLRLGSVLPGLTSNQVSIYDLHVIQDFLF